MNIPNDWKVKRLEKLVQFGSGGTPSKANKSYWQGDIPWISASTMHQQELISSDLFISKAGLAAGSKLAKENDLLLLVRGSMLWKKIPICLCKRDVAFNQDVKSLSVNKSIQANYLLYWFLAHQRFLLNKVVGTGIGAGKLDFDALKSLDILLPPLPEQKAVVDLLSIWDKAIEKTERLIHAKEKRFKGLMHELINDNGQLTTRKLGWKKVKLGDLFRNDIIVEKGKALTKMDISKGSIPVVAGGQTYPYYTNIATHEMPTVTVSASGAYAGFIWFHDYPIWASDCNVLFVVNGDTKFLFFALKSIQERVYALQSGGAQPHVYSKDMKSLTISWPSAEERQLIAETLSAAQHEIDILKQLQEKYKTQKCGLMQKMLTGAWRVKPEIVNQYMGA